MRWSIIRTIWLREMRDQLRDRRTVLMIIGLPLFLYPVLAFAVLQFADSFSEKASVIGVVSGSAEVHDFPPRPTPDAGRSAIPIVTQFAVAPVDAGLSQRLGAAALAAASQRSFDFPLFVENGKLTVFESGQLAMIRPPTKPGQPRDLAAHAKIQLKFLEKPDPQVLAERSVDLIVQAPPDFFHKLETKEQSPIQITRREDDRSRLAERRVKLLLKAWTNDLKRVRLARVGLTEQYLEPIEIRPREEDAARARENVIDMAVRVFPVLLVMWSLAGALYPAVDLCAGEKERGTMETLLITPAGREEIVVGKFLTTWVFSFSTALLNLASMGIATAQFSAFLPQGGLSLTAVVWCIVLSLPQSAFFSALALAIGAYARSSKEGQYYLMPLFIITMPLAFLTMAPGVELNALYSLIPVTGVALLMQKLMLATRLGDIPWVYFIPVLAQIGLYSWLALRWAIEQFNREEVLFREAERLDPVLWIKSLFRDKEPLPTTGQAFFALAVLIGLRWLSLGFGSRWSLQMHTIISEFALVATPSLLMAILLNTQPLDALYLRWPKGRETALAALLAILMLPPMIGLTQGILWWMPRALDGSGPTFSGDGHPLMAIMRALHERRELDWSNLLTFAFAFALLPSVCEEIAFRGFVLTGLHHGFRPRNAVLLGAFFFAVFHLNVFLFVPTFLLGVVLGLLTVRSRSLLPAISFHLLYNLILIALIPLSRLSEGVLPRLAQDAWPALIGLCLVLAAALVWWLYRKPYVELARREAAERESAPSS